MATPVTIVDKNGAPVTVVSVDGQSINFGDYVEKSTVDQPNGVAGLDANGKIPSSAMPVGDVNYLGNWNAATNTPTLANGVGDAGDLHICDVAGSQNLGGGVVAYSAGDWLIYDGTIWDRVPAGGAAPANPTALLGTAAINGTALTFMRSDAAPALNQAIVPTWTGVHTFNGSTGSVAPSIILGNTNPDLRWRADNGAVDNKVWTAGVLVNTPTLSTFRMAALKDSGNGKTGDAFITASASLTEINNIGLSTATKSITLTETSFGAGTVGIASNSGADPWAHTGTFYSSGSVGAGATAARPSPTNTGTMIVSAPNVADVQFFDSSHTADNRTAEWIYFQNQLQARFKNDAGNAAVVPLAFAGGQASGITGITSNSGSGAWTHTGPFALAGANSTIMVGGQTGTPGQVLTSTGNATAPAWSDAPLPKVVGGSSATAQSANVNTPNFYAVAIGGMYRVSTFIVITRAATTSATMPSVSVGYTEAASGVAVQDIVTLSSVANTVGSHSGGTAVIQCQQGSHISYSTGSYASSGVTSMQYRVDVIVERIT